MRDLWNEELSEKRDAKILSDIFYMENYNYFGSERIGGAFIYLKSKYKEDVKLKLGPTYDYNSDDSNENTHGKLLVYLFIGNETVTRFVSSYHF